MMKVYLDIDGVLLGKAGQGIVLASGATKLVKHLLEHYDCHWLTTHCRGDVQGPLSYLRPYVDASFMNLLEEIKPTNFDVYKTEAIDLTEDFIWIEDSPLRGELDALEEAGRLHCWKEVNTYLRAEDMELLLVELKQYVVKAHPNKFHQNYRGNNLS